MTLDFNEDVEELGQDAVSLVSVRAALLLAAQREADRIEAEFKAAKAAVLEIEQKLLPEAMAAIGLQSIELKTGEKIEVKREVAVAITEKNSAAAYEWLRSTNNDSIIRQVVTVSFGKGDDKRAEEAVALLSEAEFDLMRNVSIHAATLKAFVKECLKVELESGAEYPEEKKLPRELFGVYEFDKAIVKVKKS